MSVRVCDRIDSPLTYGVFCPVILLPKSLDRTDEVRLSFILAHEMAHIRRFDALMKWLLAAMVCIHWFNPMEWVMYVLANRDMELSCDEYVVRLYGYQTRATYALTLVGLEEHRRFASPLSNSFCKNAMKERITAIMKSKKTAAVGMGAALLVIAGAVSLFIPNARIEQGQVSAAEEENQEAFKGTEGSIRTDVSQGTEGSPKTEVIQGGEGFPKTEVIQGGEGSPKTEVSPGVENSHQMNAKNGTDNSPETDIIQTAEASPKNGNSQDKGIENPRKTDISGGEVSHNENDDEMDGKQGTAAEGKASWADRYMEGTYTQQEYDMIISALKFEGYEDMSIAEFNRKVNKVLTDDDQEYSDLMITYEFISSMLSDEDENKAFLCNTVGASIEEYQSRLEEVYTGKEVDPSFNVTAQVSSKEDVFGDEVELIHSLADYSFTYRILDQDNLTVGERDYFLETIMAKMQEYLESGKSFPSREEGDKAILEALKEIGNAAST